MQKGCLCLERPFLDLVLQTPRPRGRGKQPPFAEKVLFPRPPPPAQKALRFFSATEYRALWNAYISNSKNFLSVSVMASATIINSEKQVGICNPENPLITDMVTDLPTLITDRVTDIPNGLLGFRWGSGNMREFSCL